MAVKSMNLTEPCPKALHCRYTAIPLAVFMRWCPLVMQLIYNIMARTTTCEHTCSVLVIVGQICSDHPWKLENVIPLISVDDSVLGLLATHTYTNTLTYRFLSGCEKVENCTSQLFEPCNFPHPRNTTLLHELYLATTQLLEYMPTQCLPTFLPHGLVQ